MMAAAIKGIGIPDRQRRQITQLLNDGAKPAAVVAALNLTWETKARAMLTPLERDSYRRLTKRRPMTMQGRLAHAIGSDWRDELARRAGA